MSCGTTALPSAQLQRVQQQYYYFYFIYGLFNDASNNLDHAVSNDMLISE
jgi:hypothetical protein